MSAIELRTHTSISDVDQREWDAMGASRDVPYLSWRFLAALEKTGCVRPEAGWAPCHFTLHQDGELLAVAPAYVKGNSEGEFVFDYAWAEFAYERLGIAYYPKLVVACPFTPATGPRLLIKAGADEEKLLHAFASALVHVVQELNLSSGHVLFPRQEQARLLEQAGLAVRHGVQYHWYNRGYASFDEFLARYSSKRRNQIKRERRELELQGIELLVKTGSDIDPETVDHAYDFYRSTVNKYFWGRQYLNRAFFEEICDGLRDQVLIVLAKAKDAGTVLGGAFNLLGKDRLYGRYWGAHEDVKFLHFNVCYYKGIEECIARGLEVFEPGAGGEHKLARGFEPTLTFSAHVLSHEKLDHAIRDFLEREREAVHRRLAEERPVLRSSSKE